MRTAVFALTAIALAACAADPVTGAREAQLIPETHEVAIGVEQYHAAQQLLGGALAVAPEVTRYVQQVGARLAAVADRKLPYEFVVVDGSVPNAWALPGGKIAVSRGLLHALHCEAELAAVLGHQITHAAARHGAWRSERGVLLPDAPVALQAATPENPYAALVVGSATLAANLITRRFGRDAEREADASGMRYMRRAGYDPTPALDLQRTLVRLAVERRRGWLEGLLAGHPPSEERVASALAVLEALGGAGGERGCEAYQHATAGLRRLEPAYREHGAGVLALRSGDPEAAAARAHRALALAPEVPRFHDLLGDAALARGRFGEALAHYERSRELDPEYFKPWLASGLAAYELRRAEQADALLDHAMKLLPTAVGAYHLGRLAQEAGSIEPAIRYFQLAASSDSDVGRAAARELLMLDLSRHPERYVTVRPQVDRGGRVWMVVQNRAPMRIASVRLAAAVADPAGGLVRGPVQLGTGRQVLGPGQMARIPTPLGPLRMPNPLRFVQVFVQAARVVGEDRP